MERLLKGVHDLYQSSLKKETVTHGGIHNVMFFHGKPFLHGTWPRKYPFIGLPCGAIPFNGT
jgi:hypothetical protein